MDIGAFGKGKGKQGKGKHGKGKGKGKQGQPGQQGRNRSKDKDKNKDSIECWNCGKRGDYSKHCWSKKNTKGGSKGKHKPKNADAHNLDSTKPANSEPEVEIDEFSMTYLNVDALQESEMVRGSEWIKIGVDTGAGKTAWPQSVTYGKKLPGHVDLTFRTATGELVKSGERLYVEGCDDLKVATIGESISELEVFKRRCVNHCCLLENTRRRVESLSCMVTKVTRSTRVRMSRGKAMHRSRRR